MLELPLEERLVGLTFSDPPCLPIGLLLRVGLFLFGLVRVLIGKLLPFKRSIPVEWTYVVLLCMSVADESAETSSVGGVAVGDLADEDSCCELLVGEILMEPLFMTDFLYSTWMWTVLACSSPLKKFGKLCSCKQISVMSSYIPMVKKY